MSVSDVTDFMKIYSTSDNGNDLSVITRNPRPKVELICNPDSSNKETIESDKFKDAFNKCLLFYSYSNSIDDVNGKFSLRLKDQYQSSFYSTIYDLIEPLMICKIYRNSNSIEPDFIGIIHSKQISATIGSDGKVHKEISISGKSIVSLYADFNINLSVIGTYATSTEAANFLVKNTYFTVDTSGALVAPSIDETVKSIWSSFKEYAGNLCNVSNVYLATLIDKYCSINCQKINVKVPLCTNFYSEGEINFIQMLRAIFPQGYYEIFNRKNVLTIREKPFLAATWASYTTPYKVNVNKLTEYDFNMNDNEVYSVFMADVEGINGIETRMNYLKKTADKNGFIEVQKNNDNVKKYGYKICSVNFLGYVQDPTKSDKDSSLMKNLDLALQEMYENNHKMINGRIKLVDQMGKDSEVMPVIGDKMDFEIVWQNKKQTTSFYINSETHSWNYGGAATVEYTISRGAVYNADGTFSNTPKYFSTALENMINN